MKTFGPVKKHPAFKIIECAYGAQPLQPAKEFEQISTKVTLTKGKLIFLLQCRDAGLLPKCFHLSWNHSQNSAVERILRSTGFELLRSTIRDHRKTLSHLRAKFHDISASLMTVIDHRAFSLLHSHIRDECSQIRFQQEKVLRRKLDNLYWNQTWDFSRSNRNRVVADQELDKVVVNLSSTTLTSVEKNVLSKGLNFVPTPKMPLFLTL
ncbi:hypothetical protein M514_27391 [Trichuris suis]|uniref:Uncharacterized protein n=1 Tax=Trichuris suis TaxID=68888 RepID=A0A085MT88_9BILA|nr:hypothetical protein M514_27391 [Trichuris suis]